VSFVQIKELKNLIKEGLPHGGNLLLQGISIHSQKKKKKKTERLKQ
jgi:hypothetical protein